MTTPAPNAGKLTAPAPAKPEEEDLDELDDLLDHFTPAPSSVPPTAPQPAASSSTTTTSAATNSDAFSEDFEAALAREMEEMMRGEMGGAAGGSTNDLAAAWQKLLIGDLEGTSGQENMADLFKNLGVDSTSAGVSTDKEGATDADPDAAFQRTIRQAMDKLKSSDESARAGSGPGGDAESLAELLKALGEGGEGEDGGEGLQSVIEGMMGQLMSKEILYEPLVEMNDKFPAYFTDHPNLPEEDLERYRAQEAIVKKLVTIYQRPEYSDDNTEMNKEVLKLMNEMQELGSPPTEIMGDVPPGFDFNSADGMAKMLDSDGCTIA